MLTKQRPHCWKASILVKNLNPFQSLVSFLQKRLNYSIVQAPFQKQLDLDNGETLYFVSRNPLYTRFRSDRANIFGERKVVRLLNAATINTIPKSVISETKLELELLPDQTEPPFLHKIADVKTTKKELYQQMIGVELKLKQQMRSCNLEVKQYMHNDREPLRVRGHQIPNCPSIQVSIKITHWQIWSDLIYTRVELSFSTLKLLV